MLQIRRYTSCMVLFRHEVESWVHYPNCRRSSVPINGRKTDLPDLISPVCSFIFLIQMTCSLTFSYFLRLDYCSTPTLSNLNGCRKQNGEKKTCQGVSLSSNPECIVPTFVAHAITISCGIAMLSVSLQIKTYPGTTGGFIIYY